MYIKNFFVIPLMPFSISRHQLGPVYKSYRSFPYIAAPKLDNIMYSYKQMTHKHNFGYQITTSSCSVNWPSGSDYITLSFCLVCFGWPFISFLTLIIDDLKSKYSRYFEWIPNMSILSMEYKLIPSQLEFSMSHFASIFIVFFV